MSYLFMPAVIALLIKLLILVTASNRSQPSTLFLPLVCVLACHNLCEVLGFFEFAKNGSLSFLLNVYYMITISVVLIIYFYAIEVSRSTKNIGKYIAFSGTGVLAVLILFTDAVIAGDKSIGYIITAIQGEYYFLFQLFVLIMIAVIIRELVNGYRYADNHNAQIQCVVSIIAFAPVIIVGFIAMASLYFGFNLSGAVLFPIATTLFLLIMLMNESKHNLTDVRRFVPFSSESNAANDIITIFDRYAYDDIDYREAIGDIEKLMVTYKYQKNGGNVSTTAKLMGMPRSSLYSIFNRLSIQTDSIGKD